MGFGAPLEIWIKNISQEKIEFLFSRGNLSKQNILDFNAVNLIKDTFYSGENRYKMHFWTLLVFLTWMEKWNPVLN